MRYFIAAILLTAISHPSVADEANGHWYLSHGAVGGKDQKIKLNDNRYDFRNALGQECWVSPTKQQTAPSGPAAEERELICKIDSKNLVATQLACWTPYNEMKQRSLATSKISDPKRETATDTAAMILTCFMNAPWSKK